MKLIIHKEKDERYFVTSKDFHSKYGMIMAKDLKKAKPGDTLTTNKGADFVVLEPTFLDRYSKLVRGPQIITPKDAGQIIVGAGINKNSKIVEAGGGSGGLTMFLASIAKEVTVYERREEFIKIIKENQKKFGLTNITIKNKDVNEGISEKEVDIITLDLPEPWKIINDAQKSLKIGGMLVSYSPNINQSKQFIENLNQFLFIKTIETIERKWKITDRIMRPEFEMLGHTGFLTFARKINNK